MRENDSGLACMRERESECDSCVREKKRGKKEENERASEWDE